MVEVKNRREEAPYGMTEQEIWDAIKADYLTGEYTVKELSEKYPKSANQIYKKVSSEGWKKTLDKIRQKTEEKYVARCARVRARELEVISSAAVKLAVLLDMTVDELTAQPQEQRLKNLKGLSATASAIQSNTETLMKLYGIQTPAQEAAQKIARQRLALDQRKQRFEEGKAAADNQTAEVKVTITVEGEDAANAEETKSSE